MQIDSPRFQANESGMLTLANAIFTLLCALLIVFVMNVGHVADRKVELQSAADASAYSAGVWMARAMNAVTATNHVIGELNSFVIVHEAVGGEKLDNQERADTGANWSIEAEDPAKLNQRDRELEGWYRAASSEQPSSEIFNMVLQRQGNNASAPTEILAEATLLDAKMTLKQYLLRSYQGLVVAAALKLSPYTRPAGEALAYAMHALGFKVAQEYAALNALDGIASALVPIKQTIVDAMFEAKSYQTRITEQFPDLARGTAQTIADENGFEGELFPTPGQLRLPLQIDPLAIAKQPIPVSSDIQEGGSRCDCPNPGGSPDWDRLVKMTQLARASFPWVVYHRQPVLDAMDGPMFMLSKAKGYYFDWTNGYTKRVCARLQEQAADGADPDSHLGLYVLDGYEAPDKGYEPWTTAEQSETADELFTIIGLAQAEPPSVVGIPVFRQQHPDGMVAFAQAMIYNANEQQRPNHRIDLDCKRTVPVRQADVGWDTLNWFPGSRQDHESCEEANGTRFTSHADEHRPFEVQGKAVPVEYPGIQVNWQVKLVPATAYRLTQLAQQRDDLADPFPRLLKRMLDEYPLSLATH